MVNIHIAYTAPINPPSSSPHLTRAQVWAALQRKIRHATEFVPQITACTVLAEEEDVEGGGGKAVVVTREVRIGGSVEGKEGDQLVREVVKSYGDSWVDFIRTGDGSTVRNLVSNGPGGGDAALYMTYIFDTRHPDVEAGSEEHARRKAAALASAENAVESTIATARRLLAEGKI